MLRGGLGHREIAPGGPVPLFVFQGIPPRTHVPEPTELWQLGWRWECFALEHSDALRGDRQFFYLTMADHLAATYSEIVDDSHPGMIACEGRREFYLVAKVLPRFRHRCP